MLTKLQINNYLLIDKLELDFHSGLTVITGETGSGKSIIIDALMIVFGAKIQAHEIRNGSNQAAFIAEFSLTNLDAINYLKELSLIDEDNPNSLICRRIINSDGKSKAYVNGVAVTIAEVKDLSSYVLDIHTQHSSITLLKPEIQRNLLDEYCQITPAINELGVMYRRITDLQKQLDLANSAHQDLEQKRQLLIEKIQEIGELNLRPGEWDELELEQKQLNNAVLMQSELNKALELLAHDESSLICRLKELQSGLSKIGPYLPSLEEVLQVINGIDIELREVERTIHQMSRNIIHNPERLEEVEQKIEQIFDVSRKYKIQPFEILEKLEIWQEELAKLDEATDAESIKLQLKEKTEEYDKLAKTISSARQMGSTELSAKITQLLHKLAISGEFMVVNNELNVRTNYGLESTEYKVCFNKGLQLQPLAKVASGGELSRTALALYLLLSTHNPPEVIIFDEIDVGIGGRVAAIVGQMLAELGNSKQVICITHQPQTASHGKHHITVNKEEKDKAHITQVQYVSNNDRIAEIARMLGGLHVTNTTIGHAKELLASASK